MPLQIKRLYAPDPMPFAGSSLDVIEHGRTPKHIQAYLDNPKAKAFLFVKGRPAIDDDLTPITLHPKKLEGQTFFDPSPLFLGVKDTIPLFAYSLDEATTAVAPESFQDLRMIASRMRPEDLATIGRARGLLDWHFNHGFCPKCGTKTHAAKAGLARKCPACMTEHFPRINPVVIMMITHGDDCLLGAGHNYPEGAVSTLAGFISPGETPEEAVIREVKEEVGIDVGPPTYIFSQPWPYPGQLMMGFSCEAQSREITIDPVELREAHWFSKDIVRAVFTKESDAFLRPPRFTIAHHLLKRWLSE